LEEEHPYPSHYERLDRAVARLDCLGLYPNVIISHGNFTCSDHCPITLITEPLTIRHKAFPFRYQNYWAHYEQAFNLIKKA